MGTSPRTNAAARRLTPRPHTPAVARATANTGPALTPTGSASTEAATSPPAMSLLLQADTPRSGAVPVVGLSAFGGEMDF